MIAEAARYLGPAVLVFAVSLSVLTVDHFSGKGTDPFWVALFLFSLTVLLGTAPRLPRGLL